MRIENLIYLFLAVLVSMIVFNIVCIFVFSFQDRRLNKNNNRFAELIRKQMETGIDDKHKKYMYRKLKNIDNLQAFDLALEGLMKEDDEMAKKYFKQGVELGNNDSEYMLAGLYIKKGRAMYKELADDGLFNSKEIYDSIPEFKLNTDCFLIPQFREMVQTRVEEEEYIPNYILDIDEDLSKKYEKRIDKMLVENRLGYK